jgi:hypothetical protein
MCSQLCVFVSLVGLLPTAAPVPKNMPKPTIECEIALDSKTTGAELELIVKVKNNTEKEIELMTQLPFGVWVFADVVIEDANGKRVSEKFHYCAISSPFAQKKLCGTLPANGDLKFNIPVFSSLPDEAQKPGKYRCKLVFRYSEHTATSNQVAIEFPAKAGNK